MWSLSDRENLEGQKRNQMANVAETKETLFQTTHAFPSKYLYISLTHFKDHLLHSPPCPPLNMSCPNAPNL